MKKRKGLTLIEIVISMALIGIVAIVFLSIFSRGNKNIVKSGKRTTDTFELQEKIDSRINQIDNTGIEEVEVKIEGIDESIRIKGNLITETIDGIEITTFVPNKIEDE